MRRNLWYTGLGLAYVGLWLAIKAQSAIWSLALLLVGGCGLCGGWVHCYCEGGGSDD